MKKILLLTALVGVAILSMGAVNGGYVKFDDNVGSHFTYLTPGAGMTGLKDTSVLLTFPHDIQTVVWWPLCDSGAADADADSVSFMLYGITPHGSYEFLDSLGDGVGAGGDWADAATDSSEAEQIHRDSLWQYMTVFSDSSPDAEPMYLEGQGWNGMYVGFRIIFACTDSTDLGASLMYTYTTYGASGSVPR